MPPDLVRTAGAPARRPTPSATEGVPGPLIPALLSLSLTVGAIGLLFSVPTDVSLVMAVVAMLVGFAFLVAFVGFMLNDRDAP